MKRSFSILILCAVASAITMSAAVVLALPQGTASRQVAVRLTAGDHADRYEFAAETANSSFGDGSDLLKPQADEASPYQVDVRLTEDDPASPYKFAPETAYFNPGRGSYPLKIQVDEAITYQRIEGVGAGLTDSAAWMISRLPEIARAEIMSDLFSADGIRISYLRLPMGASDFVTGTRHYTYDDLPQGITDTQLISFSIRHDQAYIIPILKEAMRLNPDLRIMASPWSAPAWMKSSESLYGGSLKPEYYQTYADYFVKFIRAYEHEGIPIHAVTVQNEPWFPATNTITTDYPAMRMEPADEVDFVGHYLGPTFGREGISTTILIWDHNWDRPDYPLAVLGDAQARAYIRGTAWHCYAGAPTSQTLVHDAYPDKDIYFSECTGYGDGDGTADDLAWGVYTGTILTTRNWANSVIYLNLALDENHGPHLGGCTNCRGLLTIRQDGAFTKTAEYYVLAHLSTFVRPGASRIESTYMTGTLESVAFQNPDQSIVLIALNRSNQEQWFDVQWNGMFFPFSLQPNSVATFRWRMFDVHLPLVLKDHRAPTSFQNFESNNGTPGPYCIDVWSVTCLLDSAVAHTGVRSLYTNAHAGAAGSHGGTVGIYPSSASVDLSSGATFSVWVYDTQGNNTIQLKLCPDSDCICGDGGCNTIWSASSTVRNVWTPVSWELSQFTATDKTQIRRIELYEWNDGIYYFDDVTWQ